jgi:hypothetical protein
MARPAVFRQFHRAVAQALRSGPADLKIPVQVRTIRVAFPVRRVKGSSIHLSISKKGKFSGFNISFQTQEYGCYRRFNIPG